MPFYFQVHTLHEPHPDHPVTEIFGVVADDALEAELAVREASALNNPQVLRVESKGHVRFIRHTWRGPNTKTFVNGVEQGAAT